MKVLPIIICGGAGTRLFKENSENLPKQFIDFGGWTMFGKTLNRVRSNLYLPPIISTNIKYLDLVKKHLKKNNFLNYKIILEPSKKNTAPAILSSCLLPEISSKQPILFLPSDQLIDEKKKFNDAIKKNLKKIDYKDIFIFGIKPTEASDQFGYFFRKPNSIEVFRFIEKPSISKAKIAIKKNALWNAGILMSSKENIIYHFMNEQPKLFKNCLNSIQNSKKKSNFIFLEKKHYNKIKPISFDYAILENIKHIKSLKLTVSWSDLGSWKALLNFYNINKKKYFTKINIFKRPWGTYRNLYRGKNFLIKELIVKSKGCLSLQKHKHREEHWLVTEGSPHISLDKKVFKPKVKDLIFIPKGSIHRIHNKLLKPVKIIEAQIGKILKESDIVRYDDIYGRIKK